MTEKPSSPFKSIYRPEKGIVRGIRHDGTVLDCLSPEQRLKPRIPPARPVEETKGGIGESVRRLLSGKFFN